MRRPIIWLPLLAVLAACSSVNPTAPSRTPLGATPGDRAQAIVACAASYQAPEDLDVNDNGGKFDVSWTERYQGALYKVRVTRLDGATANVMGEFTVQNDETTGDGGTVYWTWTPRLDGTYRFEVLVVGPSGCPGRSSYSRPVIGTIDLPFDADAEDPPAEEHKHTPWCVFLHA